MSATSSNPPRLKNAPAGRHPERLGRYAVIEYLAAGGMADLYLVRPDGQNGYAVCKRIAEHYSGIQRIVDLFIDEGRIAAQLTHPNIVQLFESGQADGQYYLAMEYIRGRDLVAIARRGVEVRRPMDTELAVALCVQVARGLVHAHEKVALDGRPLKIVHCDISPGNVMVSWGGTAKIVDFGIARAEIQLREQNGSVAGKYNYMAPEQIRGEPIDGRADIFSLGVILYELTVGRRLFRGRPEEVMHKVLEAPIAWPREIRADYDPELERIVMAAIERDPEARTASARAFHDALSKWLWQRGKRVEKRAMAAYLRAIFSSEKVQEAEDYTAPAQLPSPASLVEQMAQADGALHLVDDDEPNDLPPPPRVSATPSGARRVSPDADSPPSSNTDATPRAGSDPQRVAPAIALVLVGLSIGLVVYFLLLR